MATTTKRAGSATRGKKAPGKKARSGKKTKKAAAKKRAPKQKPAKQKPAGKQPARTRKAKAPPRGKARKATKQGKPAGKTRAAKPARPAPPPTVRRRATPVSEYWRKLRDCGWLDHLPEAEHGGLLERLSAALAESPSMAFQSLAVTSLDPECIEGSGPDEVCSYHSVLTQLAEASFGRFQPEEILDELDPALQVARISFCVGDLSFHCELPYKDDLVQPGLFKLVNSALEASGVVERFQPLPSESQQLHLAFVPEVVLFCARKAGLIPADLPGAAFSERASAGAAEAQPRG